LSYIFLDESGCLGFDFSKQKTSKYFVISFLFVKGNQKRSLEKIIKKIYAGFPKRELRCHPNSLHCNKEKPKTRIKLLNMLNEKDDISIMVIYLNKSKVYASLADEKHVLYNYVTNILLDRVFSKKLIPYKEEKISLIASRRETNKFLNENFKAYLEQQANKNHGANVEVKIKPPHGEKCLQIVDFVCWSLFRKYEHNDDYYSNLIKNLIVEEKGLFS
jgi:hypothetical protein